MRALPGTFLGTGDRYYNKKPCAEVDEEAQLHNWAIRDTLFVSLFVENTPSYACCCCLKKNQNAPRPSELLLLFVEEAAGYENKCACQWEGGLLTT